MFGYNINIISRTKLQEKVKKATENLRQQDIVNDTQAQVLVQNGIMSLGDLISTDVSELSQVLHINSELAQEIVDKATKGIEEETVKVAAEEDEELVSAYAIPAYSGILGKEKKEEEEESGEKFSEVEKRLREELAAFKLK